MPTPTPMLGDSVIALPGLHSGELKMDAFMENLLEKSAKKLFDQVHSIVM